jgi:hypothetical protein
MKNTTSVSTENRNSVTQRQERHAMREKHTITEASEAMHERHCDDERENVIHKRVERLVHHTTPRQMRNGLQFVINEQLRRHHDETWATGTFRRRVH